MSDISPYSAFPNPSRDAVIARFPCAICHDDMNGYYVLSSIIGPRISAFHQTEKSAWEDAATFSRMLPDVNAMYYDYDQRRKEELERFEKEERLKEEAARKKEANKRTVPYRDLASHVDNYGPVGVDCTSGRSIADAAFNKIDWMYADHGNLVRIAIATESLCDEQRKTRLALEKIAKMTKKLDEVLELFRVVLTPVAEKVKRRETDDICNPPQHSA